MGYLGPPGTFTHHALLADRELAGLRPRPFGDLRSLIGAVAESTVERAVVAWDNSLVGPVGEALDLLAKTSGQVHLQRDVVMPVRMCLWGWHGGGLGEVGEVLSHPHALGQCRDWLGAVLPEAVTRSAPSTAAAMNLVGADRSGRMAAIAPAGARSPDPEMTVLARDIGDEPGGETRFVVIGRTPLPPSGSCRTVLACFGAPPAQHPDEPSWLRTLFTAFSRDGLELLWLGVRPGRRTVGDLNLVLECRGEPWSRGPLRAALEDLAGHGVRARVLGVLAGATALRLAVTVC